MHVTIRLRRKPNRDGLTVEDTAEMEDAEHEERILARLMKPHSKKSVVVDNSSMYKYVRLCTSTYEYASSLPYILCIGDVYFDQENQKVST